MTRGIWEDTERFKANMVTFCTRGFEFPYGEDPEPSPTTCLTRGQRPRFLQSLRDGPRTYSSETQRQLGKHSVVQGSSPQPSGGPASPAAIHSPFPIGTGEATPSAQISLQMTRTKLSAKRGKQSVERNSREAAGKVLTRRRGAFYTLHPTLGVLFLSASRELG